MASTSLGEISIVAVFATLGDHGTCTVVMVSRGASLCLANSTKAGNLLLGKSHCLRFERFTSVTGDRDSRSTNCWAGVGPPPLRLAKNWLALNTSPTRVRDEANSKARYAKLMLSPRATPVRPSPALFPRPARVLLPGSLHGGFPTMRSNLRRSPPIVSASCSSQASPTIKFRPMSGWKGDTGASDRCGSSFSAAKSGSSSSAVR